MSEDGPSESLYESLQSWKDIEQLIEDDEHENAHLECKTIDSSKSPNFDFVGKLVSSFANVGGGVILWGVQTVTTALNTDKLAEIRPITNVKSVSGKIDQAIKRLTYPHTFEIRHKILRQAERNKSGLIVTHVSKTKSDPVQDLHTKKFWQRIGEEPFDLPYELVRRMFLATQGPALRAHISQPLLTDRTLEMGISVSNQSPISNDHGAIFVEFVNHTMFESCHLIKGADASVLNPGRKAFKVELGHIYKGMNSFFGPAKVTRLVEATDFPELMIITRCFADRMDVVVQVFRIQISDVGEVGVEEVTG